MGPLPFVNARRVLSCFIFTVVDTLSGVSKQRRESSDRAGHCSVGCLERTCPSTHLFRAYRLAPPQVHQPRLRQSLPRSSNRAPSACWRAHSPETRRTAEPDAKSEEQECWAQPGLLTEGGCILHWLQSKQLPSLLSSLNTSA